MFLTKATMAGGKLVELKTDVVELIEEVRKRISQATGNEASIGQALIEIYRSKSGTSAHQAAVDEAIAALELTVEDVFARLEKLESYLIQINDQVEPFLLPLSSAGTHLELPLKFAPGNKTLDVGEVAFTLGGEAETALTVESFVAAAPPPQWSGPIAAGAAIQGLSLSGKIGFRGSASGAFGHGAVRFSSAMSGSGRINLYHQYAQATPRVVALVNSSRAWAVPWDLKALEARLKPVDAQGGAVGFRRVQVQGNGTLALAGGATVGRVLSYDATVNTPVGPKTLGAQGKLGAALDFSLNRNGSFTYVIEKDLEGFVTVDLVRKANTKTDRSLNLSADIEVTGLNEVAQPYLDKFFDDPADLLSKLEEWTKPGDKLIEELTAVDWKQPVVEEIGRLLLGQATKKKLTDAAIGKLEEKLQQQLNENILFWGEDSDDVAEQLIGSITERLDLGDELATKLRGELKPRLVTRIDNVNEKFQNAITGLVPNTETALNKFLTPFESVGENVQDLKQRLNTQAGDIIDPAIKLLKRYQDIRKRLLTGLQKVAQFKIGMAYAAEVSREHGSSSLLSFRIRKVNATTVAIHRAFLLGKINSVWPDFKAAMDRPEPWIDKVEGRFGAFARRDSSVGFSLSFGDSVISMTRVKASDVDVQVSPNGTVLVAAEKISQENIVKAFKVSRTVGFAGTYDLAVAARDPNAFPTPLGFNVAYDDENLKTAELEQFLGSLERNIGGRSLLRAGAARSAVAKFNELRQTAHGGGTKARVDVTLPVSVKDLAKLINITDDRIRNRAADLLIELIIQQGRQSDLLAQLADRFQGGVSEREIVFFAAALPQSRALRKLENETNLVLERGRVSIGETLVRRIRAIGRDVDALVDAVNGVRGIAQIQQEIANLPDAPPEALAKGIVQRLETLNDTINDGLDNWLKARRPLSGLFTEAVPEVTVALLALIADLSGEDAKLIPIVDIAGVEGGQIAVV